MNKQSEEQLLKMAKDLAKTQAEYFIHDLQKTAEECQLDVDWFIEEAFRQAHRIKDKMRK